MVSNPYHSLSTWNPQDVGKDKITVTCNGSSAPATPTAATSWLELARLLDALVAEIPGRGLIFEVLRKVLRLLRRIGNWPRGSAAALGSGVTSNRLPAAPAVIAAPVAARVAPVNRSVRASVDVTGAGLYGRALATGGVPCGRTCTSGGSTVTAPGVAAALLRVESPGGAIRGIDARRLDTAPRVGIVSLTDRAACIWTVRITATRVSAGGRIVRGSAPNNPIRSGPAG